MSRRKYLTFIVLCYCQSAILLGFYKLTGKIKLKSYLKTIKLKSYLKTKRIYRSGH